jgi:gamma-glutamylcysteine synthetase
VNLDFESEEDMVEKMRIGIALQPVATALFANSPFRDGKDTGVPHPKTAFVHEDLSVPQNNLLAYRVIICL